MFTGRGREWFAKLSLIALVGWTLLHAPAMKAQVAGGRILGTVSDASGGVVANASVSITDVATGVEHTITD